MPTPTSAPINPPAVPAAPMPASAATIGPAAMNGPMPGIARAPMPMSQPMTPPNTAPAAAPAAAPSGAFVCASCARSFVPGVSCISMDTSLFRNPAPRSNVIALSMLPRSGNRPKAAISLSAIHTPLCLIGGPSTPLGRARASLDLAPDALRLLEGRGPFAPRRSATCVPLKHANGVLTRRPDQGASGEQMKVDVKDALARFAVGVEHGAVSAVAVTLLVRDGGGTSEHRADERVVLESEVVQRRNMRLRNNEDVERRLRVDVIQHDQLLVLVDRGHRNLTRDHFAEQAIAHVYRRRQITVRGMSCRS